MTLFLTRYFLNEFSAWVWFTPLIFSPMFILMFEGSMFYSVFLVVLFSCAVVFSKGRDMQAHYTHVLSLAPIPKTTMVHVNVVLLGWIACCYIFIAVVAGTLLYALIHKTFLFLTLHELLFLVGCCLLLITFNSWPFKISATNSVLILNFFSLFLFTALDLPKLAEDYGFTVFSVALLLLAVSLFILRRQGHGTAFTSAFSFFK